MKEQLYDEKEFSDKEIEVLERKYLCAKHNCLKIEMVGGFGCQKCAQESTRRRWSGRFGNFDHY